MFTGGMTSTSEIGATASSISEGLGSSSAATRNMLARFHVQVLLFYLLPSFSYCDRQKP